TVIFQLVKQQNNMQSGQVNEIDQLLSTYLEEMKVENDRLQRQLLRNKPNENINSKEQQNKLKQVANAPNLMTGHEQKTDDFAQVIEKNSITDVFETSIEAQVLQLHTNGLSVTEIAQKLNRGKTEVSLIINL